MTHHHSVTRRRRRPTHPPTKPHRPRYRAARAFYLTLLLFTVFATYSLFTHSFADSSPVSPDIHSLVRDADEPVGVLDADRRCRLVHQAKDQCAYIHKNCPTDEGGFSNYLNLYYCQLAHAKPVAAIILIAWLSLLFSTIGIAASDFFCIDLSTIASILGMSESIAGVTLLAFGNGSSDVFSTFAAMSTNSGSLAVGELFGAAGFITAVVAGSMALIRPFKVSKKSFVRDVSFFIVAAAFSLHYLWDGKLHLWECISMVVFYGIYVVFILVWHWWLNRRRRRREREAAARDHFLLPDDELEFEEGAYQDDPSEHETSRASSIVPRRISRSDWSALEMASQVSNAGTLEAQDRQQDEDDEEERDRLMTEIAMQMRLTRPEHGRRARKNTITPVRPSLVGALEFQAVMKSLQSSRNILSAPLMMRRFSDDPNSLLTENHRLSTAVSDPAAWPSAMGRSNSAFDDRTQRSSLAVPPSAPAAVGRTRAVSVNDAIGLASGPAFGRPNEAPYALPRINQPDEDTSPARTGLLVPPTNSLAIPMRSPVVNVEPATPLPEAPIHTASTSAQESPRLLAPPGTQSWPRTNEDNYFSQRPAQYISTTRSSPHMSPTQPIPQLVTPDDRDPHSPMESTSAFPDFHDSTWPATPRSPTSARPPSLFLPAPMTPSENLPFLRGSNSIASPRPIKWWPYSIFPPPEVVSSALFPTVYHWSEKSWWEKCLGLVAMPSVFLLTITLPVVENDRDADYEQPMPIKRANSEPLGFKAFAGTPNYSEGEGDFIQAGVKAHGGANSSSGVTGHGNIATAATQAEERSHNYGTVQTPGSSSATEPQVNLYPVLSQDDAQLQLWNRWLTIVQLYFAPIAIVLAIYIQASAELTASWLVQPILICLLLSTVLLIPLLCTSTPTYRPRIYRIILSLIGFAVSIAWISTIASQVVGALKALAVILNMSHAIMGLTIFAVGNSLGDLVADITVAKLGYPVMALSACFGGPMLNILLGIGLSGSYIMIRNAQDQHARHPDKGMHYKVYHIAVAKTLIVSGVTLLVTLVGLLIAVPLNKWIFGRRIGVALILLWTVTTIGNVIIEVTGWPAEVEAWARWLGINSANE